MPKLNPLTPEILLHISQLLKVSLHNLVATIQLLDEGGTVPFIARYRKEVTGNLDEVQIRAIEDNLARFRDLEERRATILNSIHDQGKLTDDLKLRILAVLDRNELEDLYLPYRPKRRTKATIARERGLEPLALYLWAQEPGPQTLSEFAARLVNEEKGVASPEAALEGARHIVAEIISDDADLRKLVRQLMFEEGMVVSRKVLDASDEQEKFRMYYDYREAVSKIPSHRMLGIRRGESENVLIFFIEVDAIRATALLRSRILRGAGDWTPHLEMAIDDCWQRLLDSSIQTEIRLELKKRADADAIAVFRDNLQNLLLAAPAGPIGVLGIDPGIRTGCKVAVVDETGKFLEHAVIYPHQPKNDTAGSARILKTLMQKHNVRAVAIGNGTASRETDAFVREFLRTESLSNVFSVTVNESGASVYSASDVARLEFPDLDLTVRGAISIARRLQDPLAELVKVDPKSIGVGQYQHDVDQHQLQQSLGAVIESCVNRVGVDLNTASWTLLRYVAGIHERTAMNIVEFRNQNGRFRSRAQLTSVAGIGPKTFEQAAGFLRIRNGDNLLDSTAVHPESYRIVEQIADSLDVSIDDLITQPQLVERVKRQELTAGAYTLNDILEELRKPGRDPREQFVAPSFNENVKDLADVQPGMILEGVVTNVTKFGAFVDIGVHQDGLVHVSELSHRYIKDPCEAVKAGQIVKVKVLAADTKTRRISLSIKALQATAEPVRRLSAQPQRQKAPESLDDKIANLASRWKNR
jgi:protein Tex